MLEKRNIHLFLPHRSLMSSSLQPQQRTKQRRDVRRCDCSSLSSKKNWSRRAEGIDRRPRYQELYPRTVQRKKDAEYEDESGRTYRISKDVPKAGLSHDMIALDVREVPHTPALDQVTRTPISSHCTNPRAHRCGNTVELDSAQRWRNHRGDARYVRHPRTPSASLANLCSWTRKFVI
jgi:hypothetical protein